MASSGLGKGLAPLLAESARRLTPTSHFMPPALGVKLLLQGEVDGLVTLPSNISQHVKHKYVVTIFILCIADAVLTIMAIWLFVASPMARTGNATVLGSILLLLGTVLSCMGVSQRHLQIHA